MTRFTLRDVFWLTLVVAMGVGWWVERSGGTTWRGRAGAMKWYLEWSRHTVDWDAKRLTIVRPSDGYPSSLQIEKFADVPNTSTPFPDLVVESVGQP